jgi:glycosyltransferase involved in cell wall biosynthesis
VGGVADMVTDGVTGLLYRFEEVEMLAVAVCKIFANDSLALKLSEKSRKVAVIRHDKLINAKSLNTIYEAICKDTSL